MVKPADRSVAEKLPLLSGMPKRQLDALLQFASVQRYPAGTSLFAEGDLPDKLHIIISGNVEIYSTLRGREWGVMLMSSGDVFMPGAVLFQEPYMNSARTLASTRLLLLDGDRVRAMAASSAEFAMRLSRAIAGQFRMTVSQVLDLKCRSAAQRLGAFLLHLAEKQAASTAELPMPKRSLAARIGMTPETLSRTLQILAANGLLVRGRQVIVRDRERIERFCGPDPCASREDRMKASAG